jgi:NTE family protein
MPRAEPAAAPETPPTKVGLALSGGGFRAALFHIGVLARMAELGLLRQVEVISTVSGGSIVGALYYLHAKRLLETKPDAQIGDADYVELVAQVERDFMAAVQKNIRARIFLNLWKNFLMAKPSYSRSDRIGDLLDRLLYKPAWPEPRPKRRWGLADTQIALPELRIQPAGDDRDFRPDEHNPERSAKVPILTINATSLNTGHNWRFEAVRMGEPLSRDPRTRRIAAEVDKNRRLDHGYFAADPGPTGHKAITSRQRNFPLGLAVAASACVPTLFHPLAISGLYDGLRLELVDGGVHDNQGVQALFDADCTHLVVSDASGQMADLNWPATRIPGVAGRSISIYGDRIRDEQLMHATGRARPIVLVHLRKGLPAEAIAPLADDGTPVREIPEEERVGRVRSVDFGVTEETQAKLARVRTDLDAFGDTESFSLMLDGYLMSDLELRTCTPLEPLFASDAPGADASRWRFGAVAPLIGWADPPAWYRRALAASDKRFFKPLTLVPRLRWTLLGLVVLGLALLAALVIGNAGGIEDWLTGAWPRWVTFAIIGGLAVLLIAYVREQTRWRLLRWGGTLLISILLPLIMAPLLWVSSLITVGLTPLFLRLGRVREP